MAATTTAPAPDVFAALAALQDQLDDLVAVVTAQQRTLETLLTGEPSGPRSGRS